MAERLPWLIRSFYAFSARRHLAPAHEDLLARLPPGPGLDLATGPGEHAARIAALGPERSVVGVDIDPWMVNQARRRAPELRFEVADAAALPYPDGHFAWIWLAEAYHHFARPKTALRECHRVLRPGGELFLLEGRIDATRDEFREAFPLPHLPGLFTVYRAILKRHGYTDRGLQMLMHDMAAVGFEVHLEDHGAWALVRGRRPILPPPTP
jgi:ubiquinone/menaquinone biosynthesis C-methylase UbiE